VQDSCDDLFYNQTLNSMQHAATTLRKIFSDTLRREGSDGPLLAWPLACGTKTAERTQAITFDRGILTVAVPDETWRRQLRTFAGQYLTQLNQISSEKVSRIEFIIASNPSH
jgi:hypothetical protein